MTCKYVCIVRLKGQGEKKPFPSPEIKEIFICGFPGEIGNGMHSVLPTADFQETALPVFRASERKIK